MTAKNHTYPVTHCFTIISQNKEQSPIVLSISRKGIHATWFRLSRTFLQPTPHNISLAQKNDTLNPFRKVHLENHFMQTSYKLSRAKTKTMKNYSSCHVIDGSFATQQREDKRISLFCSILLFFWNTWPERKLAYYDVLKKLDYELKSYNLGLFRPSLLDPKKNLDPFDLYSCKALLLEILKMS